MSRGRPRKLSPAEQHEIRRYREAGVSIERLANMWSISKQTIYRVLAEQRAKLGLEQLPNKHLAPRTSLPPGKLPARILTPPEIPTQARLEVRKTRYLINLKCC